MDNNKILLLSFIGSIFGIFLLFYLEDSIILPLKDISSISRSDIEKNIRIAGIVKSVSNAPTFTKLVLIDSNSSIEVTVFQNDLKIKKNDKLEVIGKVSFYKSKLSVVADNLKNIS